MVGNRSAVGEQYVEIQPQVDTAPYLHNDSEIAQDDTRTPIATEKLLGDITNTVESVNKPALKTTVTELGKAFGGTGQDLQRIIDTGNSFIKSANDNFDVTTALIKDSNTVLHGQIDSASAIRTFARDLSLFSGTLAGVGPVPARGHRQRVGHRQPAAHLPRGQPGRPRRADQQPRHDRRRRRQAPRPGSRRSW